MSELLERLSDHARERGSMSAVQERTPTGWRWRTWAELEADVNRLCGGLPVTRGDELEWEATPGGRRIAVDLALQHLGVVGVAGGERLEDSQVDAWLREREELGRLVRLRSELRPRDPAVVRDGRRLDHAGVADAARRAAESLAVEAPGVVLLTPEGLGPGVLSTVAWGAVWAGVALVVAGPEVLSDLEPTVWIAASARVAAGAPPPSRAGALGGVLRGLGRADPNLGRRLRRVRVVGPVPPEAARFRDRGVEVLPWA